MAGKVVDRQPFDSQLLGEVSECDMEARQQRTGGFGLCAIGQTIEGTAIHPAQDAPPPSILFHSQRISASPQQKRRRQAVCSKMQTHALDIVIHAGAEHRVQSLQRVVTTIARSELERKIDQALGDARHVRHIECIVGEHGGGRAAPGLLVCECHLVMIPSCDYHCWCQHNPQPGKR